MLEIRPVTDKNRILAACRESGRVYSDAYYLYEAVSGGEMLAFALFHIQGDQAEVLFYKGDPDDAFLLDGIIRAGFHYADTQNLSYGKMSGGFRLEHFRLLQKLNMPVEEVFNIENFFSKYKNCAQP